MSIIQIPKEISKRFKALETQVKALTKLATANNEENLNFTLDGRLVGDIGELIVALAFNIKLHETQKPGRDGVFRSGKLKGQQVEIKTRRCSTAIDMTRIPQNLIVIELIENDTQAKVIYAGPGTPLIKFWKLKNTDLENADEWGARKIITSKPGTKSGRKSRRINLNEFSAPTFESTLRPKTITLQ